MVGAGRQSAIGTPVDRSTRFTILLHLPGRHTSDEVASAMITAMSDLPEYLRRGLSAPVGLALVRRRPQAPWEELLAGDRASPSLRLRSDAFS